MSTAPLAGGAAAEPVDDDDLPAAAFASALAELPGMGPARLATVLASGPARCVWERIRDGSAGPEPTLAAALGPGADAILARWREAAAAHDVAGGWRRLAASGVGVTVHGQPGYPAVLAADVEPPAVLFHRGSLPAVSGPRVTIVGTRRCSATGAGMAFELGRDLAASGVTVVSGLASGIDAAAHRGALTAEAAPPIGVVGTGLDIVYPAGQAKLWESVAAAGVLLSEAPLGSPPERWRFPARNRILAALGHVVVVVESHRRGGSFHTVDEADRRGVDVMAVPGSVRSSAAQGVNDLLAEGRPPVRDADDVLVALGLGAGSRGSARAGPAAGHAADPRPAPPPDDAGVLEALGWEPSSLDQIATRTGRPVPELAGALERLCSSGWIARQGGWYERVAAAGG